MSTPEICDEPGRGIGRRDLLRSGLTTVAALGVGLSASGTAAAGTGRAGVQPSCSLAVSPLWPWGEAVDSASPFYLSPADATPGVASLLVVPLTIKVGAGAPHAFRPPFALQIAITGSALDPRHAPFSLRVPFTTADVTGAGGGPTFARKWLAVLPVTPVTGSLQLQPVLPTGTAATAVTISADFSQAPMASSLSLAAQTALVTGLAGQPFVAAATLTPTAMATTIGASQTAFVSSSSVWDLFDLINEATAAAATLVRSIGQQDREGAFIPDMFGLQMVMNRLPVLTETSKAVVSALNAAIESQCRNCHG